MIQEGVLKRMPDGTFRPEYFIKDHLGSVRVCFTDNPATPTPDVLQVNDYYPFGMSMTSSEGENTYKYNGKELYEDHGLDWYDYGARFYDAELGRFHTLDPLSENYSFQSPFVYAANNPILFIDFMGMNASPYYDEQGNFLGVDENGFAGQIKVTSAESYKNAEKNDDGSVNSKSIGASSDTKNIQDANMSDESIANVYTDILLKTNDSEISIAKLYNGSVSVFNNTLINGKAGGYNDPGFARGASFKDLGKAGYRITLNKNAVSYLNTVENAQNTLGAHEVLGHGINGIGGDDSGQHHKVYEIQMNHSTYNKTTESHQKRISKEYLRLLHKENIKKYNSDPNVYNLYNKYYGN